MKLSGLPASERGMRDRVEKDGWQSRQVEAKGGRGGVKTEYQPPAPIMALIKEKLLQNMVLQPTPDVNFVAPRNCSTDLTLKPANPGHLKDWQREIGEARAAICMEVKRLAEVGGIERAIRTVIDLAAKEALAPQLQRLVPVANAKAGTGRMLSRTTLYRWLKELPNSDAPVGNVARLAPKTREANEIPAWAPYLLNIYSQPQKPSLAYCVEQLIVKLPGDIAAPSYAAAHRFIQKMSNIDRERGRMGSREIKNILPFVRRDTKGMWPTDCYTADGHTFDAEVAHPAHGKAFRPEITTVLDIATRKAVGWSIGLAESTWAVLDALRNACETGGIPAIFYVDNGSGYKNATMSDESTGFMARLSIRLEHSLPYNSQARGIIERAHQTIWVRGAKTLPTYMGAQMDPQAKQKVFKLTRKEIKTTGTSRILIEWSDFVTWCQQQIDAYNNKPHSSLPKIRAVDGTKRHQTPNEAWEQAMQEGWKPVEIEQHERDDLFRPYKTCKIIRGEVRLFNNVYFSHELAHHHGETAQVGYDIHDASRVWVRERSGRLICVAEFEANKRAYFAESVQDQANYKRMQGRIKRAEAKIDEAREELEGRNLIEYQPVMELPPMAIEPAEPVPVEMLETTQPLAENVSPIVERPHFKSTIEKYTWLMQNKFHWTNNDAAWLVKYVGQHQYYDMLQRYTFDGIGWTKEDEEKAKTMMTNEENEVAAQ